MRITNILLCLVGTILLLWFAAPLAFHGILNVGNILGMLLGIILIIYGLSFSFANRLIARLWKMYLGRILLLLLSLIILAAFVIFVVVAVNIIASSIPSDTDDSTVVVLGCRVREDGPSLMLSERINTAYRFLTDNPEKMCILSGGKGSDEPVSEARCMFDRLTEMGIDPERLILEEESTSTYENLLFSSRIISERNLNKRITVITNDFHMYRAMLLSDKLDLDSYRFPARTSIIFYPTYFVREICGVIYYFLFGLK